MIIANTNIVCPWVAEHGNAPLVQGCTGLGLVQDDKMVAGVMYDHYTGRAVEASIVILPEAVLTKKFMWIIFDYPFTQLAVDQIIAYNNSNNTKSKNLLHRLGFRQVGVISGVYDDGGDQEITVLLKQNCKWLEKDYEIVGKDSENS